MPNTNTIQVIGTAASRDVIVHVNIVSDGSEETSLIVYDNSTLINNVHKGKVVALEAYGGDCSCTLYWDQTTDSPIVSFNPSGSPKICFRELGNRPNPDATGATGDILLSTANLDAGDAVSIFITVRQE